jgi:hypothetical protein
VYAGQNPKRKFFQTLIVFYIQTPGMTPSVRTLLMIVFLSVCSTTCTNKSNNGPVLPQTVEWSIDNGTSQSAETITFIRNGYNFITAAKGTTNIFLATNSTAIGIYTLATTTADMGLNINGKQWVNFGCDISISSNSNSTLKGSFNGTFGLANVDTVNITGTFEDVVYY